MPGPDWAWQHPWSSKNQQDDTHVWMHTCTYVIGFKWWEKSLCHGSMMDHYGWVTSTGKSHKAHWIEGPEGGRTGFKEGWEQDSEPYNSTPHHLFPIYTFFPQFLPPPTFHYSFLLFSPLLRLLLLSYLSWLEGFPWKQYNFCAVFLFQLFLLHPQKGARGVGHKTLNHRHEEYTLQGQQFFDHSLALSAKKLRGRFIWSVLSKQWNCVNTAKWRKCNNAHCIKIS